VDKVDREELKAKLSPEELVCLEMNFPSDVKDLESLKRGILGTISTLQRILEEL